MRRCGGRKPKEALSSLSVHLHRWFSLLGDSTSKLCDTSRLSQYNGACSLSLSLCVLTGGKLPWESNTSKFPKLRCLNAGPNSLVKRTESCISVSSGKKKLLTFCGVCPLLQRTFLWTLILHEVIVTYEKYVLSPGHQSEPNLAQRGPAHWQGSSGPCPSPSPHPQSQEGGGHWSDESGHEGWARRPLNRNDSGQVDEGGGSLERRDADWREFKITAMWALKLKP